MPRRVFLHVGTPKSGTSYLQDRLALNRPGLEAQGLTYPETRAGDHFEAALDLIGDRWAGAEKQAQGQWEALSDLALEAPTDDVVLSHEILAAAAPERVAIARESLTMENRTGTELHVVVTARDLARQVPAEWQERIKHRGGREYAAFVDAVVRNHGRTDWLMWFWRVQDLPVVLERWGAGLDPAHVHLVTVPGPGGSGTALWDRFASVLGLDPAAPYAESATTNASLGGDEVTLLRRLNHELSEREVPRETYVEWVRELVVKDVLATRPGMRRATVPPQHRAFVDEVAASWVEQLATAGYDVVGDLDDLVPRWPDDEDHWLDPDDPDLERVADAAVVALAHVLDKVSAIGVEPDAPTPPAGPLARFAWRFRS
jgi:hypothetical protein